MRIRNVTIGVLVWLVCLGCAQDVQQSGQLVNPYPPMEGVIRRAVIAGLTNVDPAAYGGWAGACPGTDTDAKVFDILCQEQGLQTSLHLNSQATKAKLFFAAEMAWEGMKAGDLFVFYISGHGGQEKDVSGDEEDGQDETLCLWDGNLSDDYLFALWQKMPAGVRVLFVTDTCNSGTNYRARHYMRTVPREYKGQLIHFGGCDDGLSSYGSDQGGVFTTALIDAWNPNLSYRKWFDAANKKMAISQVPIYAEYGQVQDDFRLRKALQ